MVLEIAEFDPAALLPRVDESLARLLATAERLDEAAVREPSLLPGWTRAHVLTHLARAFDSRVRLLVAARSELPIPQYASQEERDAEIEDGARRPARDIVLDLRASAHDVREAIASHPDDAWDTLVTWLENDQRPVHRVVSSLLQESEIHHVDLAAGYTPDDWPRWFAADELARAAASMRDRGDVPPMILVVAGTGERHRIGDGAGPVVSGPAPALLAWLTGRTRGDGLAVEPPGPLPEPPEWK